MVRSCGPDSGAKLRNAWPVMVTGKAESSVICKGICCTAPILEPIPVRLTDGVCGSVTLMENRSENCFNALSVTVTANEKLPAALGVPLIRPEFRSIASPVGSPLADHVYGGVPPVAASACENGWLNGVSRSCLTEVIESPAGATVKLRDFVAVKPLESATWTVMLNVPAVVGVPANATPAESNTRPGTVLPTIDQE